ncbi:MAG: carboxypeptidase regulatory-like domain-containing protein, partial [Candidatus Acidiferrales bacterium]
MKGLFKAVGVTLAVCVLCIPATVHAQTAASAYVSGTVYDQTQAVVPNATVEFRDPTTGIVRSAQSNNAGIFVLSQVPPGTYKVSVSASGFRTSVIPALKVDVAKSYTLNFNLEVGAMAETVEVTATAGIELATTDATVGTVYAGEGLLRLPTSDRGVASLLIYQPLVTPAISEGGTTDVGGNVAGARSDQTTYLLDGGDATSNTEGTGGYNIGFDGAPRPIVPTPAESVEEFRVGTTNPNATFGRAQGGQVSIITKRGTNDLHGSVYWYHQNDNLNANEWELNSSGRKIPELKDNRYGFSVGGPVFRDKTFLYGHYEGRRFPRTATITRMVPTDTFRQGIIRYVDVNGVTQSLNFNPGSGPLASTCGATGAGACDPLGVGRSPVTAALWALYPAGNTPSLGDGLNNIGFRAPVDNTLDEDFFVVRFDQKVTDKWNAFASYRYSSTRTAGVQQVDIVGISGCDAPCPTRTNPLEPRYLVGGLTGQITPTLTSETRVSWFRHWWEWATAAP